MRKQAVEEYDILSKNLRTNYEKDIEKLEKEYHNKLLTEKKLLMEEIEVSTNIDMEDAKKEIKELQECSLMPNRAGTDVKQSLQYKTNIKMEQQLQNRYQDTIQALKLDVKNPMSEIVLKIKSEYQTRLQKEKDQLIRAQKYENKMYNEEKQKLLSRHEDMLVKKQQQAKDNLSERIQHIRDDHEDAKKTSKEMVDLNIQTQKEKQANQFKLILIEEQRKYRHQLEKIEQQRLSDITSSLKKYSDQLLKQLDPSQIEALKKQKLVCNKLSDSCIQNQYLIRDTVHLKDKLDSCEDDVKILSQERKKLQQRLDNLNSRAFDDLYDSQACNIPTLQQELADKQQRLSDTELKIDKLKRREIEHEFTK